MREENVMSRSVKTLAVTSVFLFLFSAPMIANIVAVAAGHGPVLSLDSLRTELWNGEMAAPKESFTLQDVRVNGVDLKTHDQLLIGQQAMKPGGGGCGANLLHLGETG